MLKGRPRAGAGPANTANVEALLRGLQEDIERFGKDAVKQRRRHILKGFRAGFWAAADKPSLPEVALALRAELFGHSLATISAEVDELERVAVDGGYDPWLVAMESGPRSAPEGDED